MKFKRRFGLLARLGLALAVLATLFGFGTVPAHAAPIVGTPDAGRTKYDPNEPGLAPAQVSAADFGQQFSTQLNGSVYARPLVVGDTAFIATENNYAYGIDVRTGAISWQRSMGAPVPASAVTCGDLVPNIGSTSTPAFDAATNTVYFTTKVDDGPTQAQPHWYLQAVDVTTGTSKPGYPLLLQGTADNDPTVTFNPLTHHQRPGLLLANGKVYIAFGAHCDYGNWRGWVMSINVTGTPAISSTWVSQVGTRAGGGIWQSGGGIVSDGTDANGNPRLFFSTGNGISPPKVPGSQVPGSLAESVVRLETDANGHLKATDFFSPFDADVLDLNDTDLGSGGPVALPDSFGTASRPHLLVQVGKDGRVYLLDRDNLGGRAQGAGGGDAVVQMVGPFRGVWGHPGVYPGEGGYVYTVENNGPMRAFKAGTNASGSPTLTSVATSNETFGYTSGSPVITSANGTPGSALVWVQHANGNGVGGQIRAYDAVPVDGKLNLRWSAPVGNYTSKFTTVATANGRVLFGTRDGRLLAFGRPATSALVSQPVDFGNVAVGATATATAHFVATKPVTVSAASVGDPFTVNTSALPVTLSAGQSLDLPVSFTPTTWGAKTSQINLTTTAGTIAADVHGVGIQPGLGYSPSPLAFGQLVTGANKTMAVSVLNTGGQVETVRSVTGPTGMFSASDLPAAGTQILSQNMLSIPITYTPTSSGTHTGTLSITTDNGTYSVTVNGSAISGAGELTITPTSMNYGSVAVGTSRTLSFNVANTGNAPLTITLAKAPVSAFTAAVPLAEGLILGPGSSVRQDVTFTPSATGTVTDQYQINSDDGLGIIRVQLTGTGIVGNTLSAPPEGWTLNGSAAMSGTDLRLTEATSGQHGSAFANSVINSVGMSAKFQLEIGGGSGADGLTYAMIPSDQPATSLGAPGGALGVGGIPGAVAVTFDTFQNGADPSSNFIGVMVGWVGTDLSNFNYLASSSNIASLKTGTHDVEVNYFGGLLRISFDGELKIEVPANLPTQIRPGFTAATGGETNQHTVRNIAITASDTVDDTTAPQVQFTSPEDGQVVSGNAVLLANASDAQSGVAKVVFKVDGTIVNTDTAAPYQYSWDTKSVGDGGHELSAIAVDGAGNTSAESKVNVTVKNTVVVTAAITAPAANATVSGPVPIAASVTGGTAPVTVAFKVDGTQVGTSTSAPYSYSWDSTTVADGTHELSVVATDTNGVASTVSKVSVTVANTPAVTVALTAPAANATVSGAAVPISATAAGGTGALSVKFQVDGTDLATDTTAPFAATWDSTKVANGTHEISAVATDAGGRSSAVAKVSVTVNNVAPVSVQLIAPPANATVGGSVPLAATVTGGTNPVTVSFKVDGTEVGTDSTAPYSITWDSTKVADGTHEISAIASDAGGVTSPVAKVSVTVKNAPVLTLASPTSGATVWGNTPLTASVIGGTGAVSVAFKIDAATIATDTTAPYAFTWNSKLVADGTHQLSAVATDAAGRTSTVTRTITVQNLPPVEAKVSAHGSGTVTAPTFNTTGSRDLILAFVTADGPTGQKQSATVTGGGLTWTLVKRANTVTGTAEVWSAVTSGPKTGIVIKSTPKLAGVSALVVVAIKGTAKVGATGGSSGTTGAPNRTVVATAAGSWFYAVGNDPKAAINRSVATDQPLVYQWLDTPGTASLWVQSYAPGVAAGTTVGMKVKGPATNPWNYTVIEVARA